MIFTLEEIISTFGRIQKMLRFFRGIFYYLFENIGTNRSSVEIYFVILQRRIDFSYEYMIQSYCKTLYCNLEFYRDFINSFLAFGSMLIFTTCDYAYIRLKFKERL